MVSPQWSMTSVTSRVTLFPTISSGGYYFVPFN